MTRPRRADAGMFMNAHLHCHLVEIVFTTNAEHHEISDGAAAACLSGDLNAATAIFASPLSRY
jgi:hypothetical protein